MKTKTKTNRFDGYGREIAQFAIARAHAAEKGDSQAAWAVQHLVTETLAEVFRHEFEAMKFVNQGLVPWDFGVNPGALSVGWYDLTHNSGNGDGIVADDADDVPIVDLQGSFNINKTVTVALAFKYSRQDIRVADMQGKFGLIAEKSSATREEHDRRINNLVRNGSNDGTFPGLYRFPGISVALPTTGNWAAALAGQIETDFNAAVTTMLTNTKGVHEPNTALFPIAVHRRISTLRSSTSSDISVLEYLQKTNPFITRWDWEDGLLGQADSGSVTANSALIYKNDPSIVRAVMPQRLVPLPPQEKGLCITVAMESRYGGLVVPKPMAICRIDGV
jgi:hypothetical protein